MNQMSDAQKAYIKKQKYNRLLIGSVRILILMAFLFLWEMAASLQWIDPFIFSSPSQVVNTFLTMWSQNQLSHHLLITLTETLISFFLVVIIGLGTSVLLWCCPRIAAIAEPYLVVLNSLPKSALAPLLIVWLGSNIRTIVVAGISVAIFGSIINLYTAFQEVNQEKIKLIYTLNGTRTQALTKVVLPASIPQLLGIMKVNIGLCLVGVIIGEFIGSRSGLGYLIIYGTQTFKLDWVIMSILVLCIVATCLYALLSHLEKWYLNRY